MRKTWLLFRFWLKDRWRWTLRMNSVPVVKSFIPLLLMPLTTAAFYLEQIDSREVSLCKFVPRELSARVRKHDEQGDPKNWNKQVITPHEHGRWSMCQTSERLSCEEMYLGANDSKRIYLRKGRIHQRKFNYLKAGLEKPNKTWEVCCSIVHQFSNR